MQKVNLSNIENKISHLAFEAFRAWTKNAKEKYPHLDLTIRDEGLLVSSCRSSITSAVRSLYKQDKFKTDAFLWHWDIGFVLGFIQGNLGLHWYQEYIVKQSEQYKFFSLIKALRVHCMIEDLALIKVEEYYKKFLEIETNLMSPSFEVPELDVNMTDFTLTKGSKKGTVITLLENFITREAIQIGYKDSEDFMPSWETLLTTKEVQELIKNNEWLKKGWEK